MQPLNQTQFEYLAPGHQYEDTKANIEALTGVSLGAVAFATDTFKLGTYNGLTWDWGGGGVGGGNLFQIDSSLSVSATYGTLGGTINGSNTTFTVSLAKYISGSLYVSLNGQLLTQGPSNDWTETTPTSGIFDFVIPPPVGSILIVVYQASSAGSSDADTLDGYHASSFLHDASLPSIVRGIATLDFGSGNYTASVTVTDVRILATSHVVATILCEAIGTNTSDDILIQPLEVKISDLTAGSFKINVNSLQRGFIDKVQVSYILI